MLTRTETPVGGFLTPGLTAVPYDVATVRRTAAPSSVAPCAARPSTRFVHPEGRCGCFVGGPAPVFDAPAPSLTPCA